MSNNGAFPKMVAGRMDGKRTPQADSMPAHAKGKSRLQKSEGAVGDTKLALKARSELECTFDQVWVINLKRRADRLTRFCAEIDKAGWPFQQPQVFYAIEGDKVGVPKYWQTGGGSYGCLRSHITILERAIQDDINSILIMEDDAVFMDTFAEDVREFLGKVPQDWQCLMLGGQHVNSQPIPVLPGLVRAGGGGGIQRTHCYALRGREVMKALYGVWSNAAVHCDWVMGPCMAKFNTYAPDPFLVGQSDGPSDISGQKNPTKFWRSPSGTEPVAVLHAPKHVMEALRAKNWHGGYTRDPATGIDVGLRDLFADAKLSPDERDAKLKDWINMIQWEVASMTEQAICTIWHPAARADVVRRLVRGKVVEVIANSPEEALGQLPQDIHTPQLEIIHVALLHAPRQVLEALRDHGWHSGHWRDEVTGQDNGIRRLFGATSNKMLRSQGIRDIARTLYEEVSQNPRGVVTIWADEISPDMVADEDIRVHEIHAATAEEAIAKWAGIVKQSKEAVA
jgi:hypothetical protein